MRRATDAEPAALIKTSRSAERRSKVATADEIDPVGDRDRPGLLRRARVKRRRSEVDRQSAILDALPANIVLLDSNGVIVAVNEAWRQLADATAFAGPDYGIGLDYLAVCDGVEGTDASSAREVAAGIRSVLSGASKHFSVEYACDTAAGRTWFQLTIAPLDHEPLQGVVVMHVDITGEKRSKQSLLRFAAAMDATVDAIYLIDRAEMQFIHFNDAACRMENRTREEIFARGLVASVGIPAAELEHSYDLLIAGAHDEEPFELLRHRADGTPYWLEVRRQALVLDERWTIVTLIRDVTERKLAQYRIAQLNRVQAMLSGINTLIVRTRDRAELFKQACRIAVEAGGFRMAWIGLVDRGLLGIVPVASVGATEDLLACIERGLSLSGATAGESPAVRVIREKKPIVTNDVEKSHEPDVGGIFLEAGIRSVAKFPLIVADEAVGVLALYAQEMDFFHADELKLLTELAGDVAFAIDHIEKQERLEYLAFYDPLTGLANRTLFLDRVTQCMRTASVSGHTLALVLIDLERFKNLNDSLGRPAGDEFLRQVAEWLRQSVGDSSRLSRVAADHFAVLVPAVSSVHDLPQLIEKTLYAFLKHSFRWNGASYRLSAKTGVALFPNDGVSAEALFANAEAALKKAKSAGDPYLFYSQAMTDVTAGRLSLENQLRQALDQEQFVLHYQPKIDLATGKIMGAEALIRWNDPNTGLVPPARFIPILEETGLINEVGRWALHRAAADHLCWHRAGLTAVRIAVNVSPIQLGSRNFAGEIARVVRIDPLAAAGLELEITESLIMADIKHSIASLKEIRAMGVTVAIDDFGTGFSSLSYLAQLPINTLKIDRSFVADLKSPTEGNVLVAMIINLAHSLKLDVVAEGVETEAQATILGSLNCDHVQGYLYSKALPATAFAEQFLSFKSSARGS